MLCIVLMLLEASNYFVRSVTNACQSMVVIKFTTTLKHTLCLSYSGFERQGPNVCWQNNFQAAASSRISFAHFKPFTAITGSGIVMAISPEHARGKLGATIPSKEVSDYQAFGVELIASFLLVLTMLASIDANKDAARRDYGTAAALGVVVTLCYLIAVS